VQGGFFLGKSHSEVVLSLYTNWGTAIVFLSLSPSRDFREDEQKCVVVSMLAVTHFYSEAREPAARLLLGNTADGGCIQLK
jgi:hypothetical protein